MDYFFLGSLSGALTPKQLVVSYVNGHEIWNPDATPTHKMQYRRPKILS